MVFDEIRVTVLRTFQERVRIAAAVLLVWTLVLGSGCAQDRKGEPQQRASADRTKKDTFKRTEPADPFDLGAGRKPTADTMYALAKIVAGRDRPTESMDILRNIISQYPNYLPAYNALAEAYIQSGQSEEAIATLNMGLKRARNDPVLLNNLGMAHFLREEYADALPHFEKAADLRPEVPLYRANKAAALGMLGRAREARLEYRQILRPNEADENVDILSRARRRATAVAPAPAAAPAPEAEPAPTGEAAGASQSSPPVAGQP